MNIIDVKFDPKLIGYIVSMPDPITLDCLLEWQCRFDQLLEDTPVDGKLALLIDTGTHNFASVECLKFLRDYLSQTPNLAQRFECAAFVTPKKYVAPHVVSKMEAYFDKFGVAYKWLCCQH